MGGNLQKVAVLQVMTQPLQQGEKELGNFYAVSDDRRQGFLNGNVQAYISSCEFCLQQGQVREIFQQVRERYHGHPDNLSLVLKPDKIKQILHDGDQFVRLVGDDMVKLA